MIKECLPAGYTTFSLHHTTIERLNKLDENDFRIDLPGAQYSYSIALYKQKQKKKLFSKDKKWVFCLIANFEPYESDVWVTSEEDYELCKKLGEELGYKTITKGWLDKDL